MPVSPFHGIFEELGLDYCLGFTFLNLCASLCLRRFLDRRATYGTRWADPQCLGPKSRPTELGPDWEIFSDRGSSFVISKHPERYLTQPGSRITGLIVSCHPFSSHHRFIHLLPSTADDGPIPQKSFYLCVTVFFLWAPCGSSTFPWNCLGLVCFLSFHFSVGVLTFQPNRRLLEGSNSHCPFLLLVCTQSDSSFSLPPFALLFPLHPSTQWELLCGLLFMLS